MIARAPKLARRRDEVAAAPPSLARLRPMLAVAGSLPSDRKHWAFEFKWDGVRALCACGEGTLQLSARSGIDITNRYPELHGIADAIGKSAILDGEIIAVDAEGVPSFALLQRRMHVSTAVQALRLSKSIPVSFVAFDLLSLDGRDLTSLPYEDRRAKLESLGLAGPLWQTTPSKVGAGKQMLDVAVERRLEGIVAKRLGSPYEAGRRSANWLKIKIVASDEFLIGGWMPEKGDEHRVGALLMGYYDAQARLHYAGAVGSGLAVADQREMQRMLTKHATDRSPFAEPLPRRGVNFVKPQLVAEIEYRRWPDGGLLQQPAFKGFRSDKDPSEVIHRAVGKTVVRITETRGVRKD